MTATGLREIDAASAHARLADGQAVLIDVREPDEFAREHIPGARLVPLSGFDPGDFAREHDKIGIFHCRSGNRTAQAAQQILSTGFKEVYHLDGGLQAWRAAGLPVTLNRRVPISIMRQVQIAAGSLVVLGAVLALTVSPWFIALSGLVGAGLVFAGISGFCAAAKVLGAMPWNRQFAPKPSEALAAAN